MIKNAYMCSSKELTSVIRSGKEFQNGKHWRVSVDQWRDFLPLAGHMTKLKKFAKYEIHEFSAFPNIK